MNIGKKYFPHFKKTESIIRSAIDIHKHLGFGFLEIVYKDSLEIEFKENGIPFERKKQFAIHYKEKILPHLFYADFVVYDKVILEVKAKNGIASADLAQTLNYLKCSDCRVGLILNFGCKKLQIKRVIL